jgi:hypothetical protein
LKTTAQQLKKYTLIVQHALEHNFNNTQHTHAMNKTPLAKINKNQFFKLVPTSTAPVYLKNHYDRESKTYSISPVGDYNRESFKKGKMVVFTGFTY